MAAVPPTDPWPLPELTRARRAIVVVDVVESVRLMQEDEAGFIDRWRRFVHAVRSEVLPKHGGRMVKSLGDGMLLEFEAVPPAVAVAHELHALSSADRSSRGFLLRIGVHLADVVVDEIDVFGSGVNLAARLTQLAGPGQTVMSAQARECVLADFDAQMEDLGECYLKHIAQPMRAFRVAPAASGFGDATAPHADTTDLRPTVAVLPFASYEAGASGVCVGDVVTDQVIAALSRSPSINVISRLSTTAFRQRAEPLTRIASALGAHFVASGRYRSSNGMLQVQVELADARTGHVLWSHSTVDSESAALVPDSNLVRTISEGIAAAMFAAEVGSVRGLPLPNLQSHTLLIAAISLLYRLTLVDFDRARSALDALQERAPRHPAPLAWLARWHLFRVVQGWSDDRESDGRAALAYARRALDLDAESSLALTMLGNVSTSFVRDLDAAQRWYDRALSINPNESLAWLQKGNCLSFAGDGAAALQHVERAVALSPLDPARHFYLSLMASSALSAGKNERAIEAATASLRLNADHVSTYRVLAIAQSLSGLTDEARRTVTRLMTLEPDLTVARFVARSPGAASGLAQTFGDALHAAGVPMGC